MPKADIIIIGGGPGGYETAAGAAAMGKSVVLFEKAQLGGTCLNRGCIPTKCLCAAASVISTIKGAGTYGIAVEGFTADYAVAHRRAASVMDELRSGIEGLLGNVEVVNAEASLAGGNKVCADGVDYEADTIIIATGSRPARLPIPGMEHAIDSDTFLALDSLPKRLTIIGGGVIGLEFASVANAYGTEVTVVEYRKEILPGLDADVAKRLRSMLSRKGIEIITDAKVTEITAEGTVRYERRGKTAEVGADMVLAAVGRTPVVPQGCPEAGVATDARGFIVTDADMRTTAPGIYAIGDVNGRCMLAHAASAQGRRVLGEDVNLDVIPSVVFTEPECAFVRSGCDDTRTVKIPYGSNGKALAQGLAEGFVKLEFDSTTGRIVACAAIGAHAADLIAEATLAITQGLTAEQLRGTVHAHPTLSELLVSAL